MTTEPDPASSWQAAEQLAARQNVGAVHKRSDGLPYLFTAERARCVLVHRGAVIAGRGPAIAGAYLRDLGIAQGKGPSLDDVLWALWALEALPDVAPLAREGYVHVPGDRRLAQLTARIEHDGRAAHIVLHYFKPEPKQPRGIRPGSGGRQGPARRELVRMTLDIPRAGDAAWRRAELPWTDPG